MTTRQPGSAKPRVLLTNFHTGYDGGHKTYIHTLLASEDVDYYVACPTSSDTYKSLFGHPRLVGIEFPSKPKELAGIVANFKKLLQYIRANDITVIHTNGSPDHRMAIYLKYWMRITGRQPVKVIYTKHNSFPVKGAVSNWRMKKASDALIFVCRDAWVKCGSPTEVPYAIIENGVNLDNWCEPVSEYREEKINLVSIAGVMDYKRWDVLLDALNTMDKDKAQRFSVTLVGGIPYYAQHYIDQATSMGYELNFLPKTSQPKDLLVGKDVGFVLSDSVETISFACREMMAFGLPVMVSDFAGLPDNVTHGHDGWITKAGSVESVRGVLERLCTLCDADFFAMKSNAQERAKAQFSDKAMQRKTTALLSEL